MRCTQVRGPLVEVKPLRPALLLSYSLDHEVGLQVVLLELWWSRLELLSRLEVQGGDHL